MTGLSRFDFYPRDWISGTRGLSLEARGVYIDLLARIYDLGQGLDYDVPELRRYLGLRDRRQLQRVLDELIAKGKIVLVDGKLINPRAVAELQAAHERIATGKKGGRPRKPAPEIQNENAPKSPSGADFGPILKRSDDQSFEENQQDNKNPPSPSPSPSYIPPTEAAFAAPAPAPEKPIYDYGKSFLGQRAGGLIRQLIEHHRADLPATMATLREAAGKSDPRAWIGGVLRNPRQRVDEFGLPVEPPTDWANHPDYRGAL